MSPEVHRAALRAAAKLALSAAFLGCGAAETTAASGDPTVTDDPSTNDTSSDALRAKKKKTGTSATNYCPSKYPNQTEEQWCRTEVAKASFPTTWAPTSAKGDTRVDAGTRACCDLIAKAIDKGSDQTWAERGECCAALGWQGSTTCTPWGPPVPPAMRRVA